MSIFADLIALEEDITSQVQQATTDAIGQGSMSRRNPDGFDGNRDMNQTDDIFGLQGDQNGGNDNPTGNEAPTDQEDDATADENPDDTGDDLEGETDDQNLDDTGEDDEDTSEPPSIYQKNKLKKSMILFYRIISNDIKLLTESLTSINDVSMIATCNKVLERLRETKEYLMQEINTGLEEHPYEESLRKYVALRRVYDISIEILDKHFGNAGKK